MPREPIQICRQAKAAVGRLKYAAFLLGLLLAACLPRAIAEPFATGLNQPRGMVFDMAGNLFVAEAGVRATPAGGSAIGRVIRISPRRELSVVVDGLPFTALPAHGDAGAADVAIVSDTLLVLTGEGSSALSRSVLRALPDGSVQPIASLLNFAAAGLPRDLIGSGLVANNPSAMVAAPDGSAVYVADGASGRVLRVSLDGAIEPFAELPGMPPLTGMAFGPDASLYFANFSPLPHAPGSGAIWAADRSGNVAVAVDDLTMPIDVAFDAAGALYVLEFSDGRRASQPYAAGLGRLLRIEREGARTIVLDRLNYPTAMAFSESGDLYIAVNGAWSAAGQGEILRLSCHALGAPATCPEL
ncbi:MAG TPA: ScyD/ScyE family protein [Roseiflexaceae bacterium]|nr:ScyD/ScyE family protein [Roseiflexaceae bacterium]